MATTTLPPEKLRTVGLIEQYFTHRHHLNYYTCVATSAFYHLLQRQPSAESSPTDLTDLQSLIYTVLQTLIPKHPVLSVTVLDEHTSTPYYSPVTEIDLSKIVTFHPAPTPTPTPTSPNTNVDIDLDPLIQSLLGNNFKPQIPNGVPPWRVNIVPTTTGFWVIFTFHHALSDGLGGFVFHRHFLRILNSLPPTSTPSETSSVVQIPLTSRAPLPPSMEGLYKFPLGLGYLLCSLRDEYLPILSPPQPNLWLCGSSGSPTYTPPPPEDKGGLKTNLLTLRIPADLTSGLISLARQEKTRVTSLLSALLPFAFLQVFPSSENVRVSVIVSARRWVLDKLREYGEKDDEEGVMGIYVTQFLHTLSRGALTPPSGIFTSARAIRSKIDKVLTTNGRNTEVGLLRYVNNFDTYFSKKTGQQRVGSLDMSNIGVFKVKDEGEQEGWRWSVRDVAFAQSASVTGGAVACSVVALEGGGLRLGFTWQDGVVERVEMERVVESVKEVVAELVKGGN